LNAVQVAQLNLGNEQYFASAASSFPNTLVSSANPLLIADKTLAYDATALLTAAFKELHLIIQQQLLDF
jgi:hypothetical protein